MRLFPFCLVLLQILSILAGSAMAQSAGRQGTRTRIISVSGERFEIGIGSRDGVSIGMIGVIVDPGFLDQEGRPLPVARFRIAKTRVSSSEGDVLEVGAGQQIQPGMEAEFEQALQPPGRSPGPSSPDEGGPACAVSATELEFGEVKVGEHADKIITVRNSGGGSLEGRVSVPAGDFSLVSGGGSYALSSGQSVRVKIRYAPSAGGSSSRTVTTGEMCSNVVCRGTGVQTASSGSSTAGGSGSGSASATPTGFVRIQPGTFRMGSPSSEKYRDSDEGQHGVTLTRAYYMSDHEVTQGEWESVMGWNASRFRGRELPVESVTWYDCLEYCNKRSRAEGLREAYSLTGVTRDGNHIESATVSWRQDADGYRLPTEAEWEYACRAGSSSAFWNGDITEKECGLDRNLDQVGWYCGNASSKTHPVKGKRPNAWDLYDMHGNVYEWCWDWKVSYASGSVTDPTGPGSGSYRVIRGGSWSSHAQRCRSAGRYYGNPGSRLLNYGFRLVRSAF